MPSVRVWNSDCWMVNSVTDLAFLCTSPLAMSAADIGLPMVGSYFNVILYTLELVEAYIYYFASARSLKDPIFLKCCVATSLVSDIVGTIGVCGLSFVTTLETVTPGKLYWGYQMYLTGNMTSAFIFQSYMVHRYWTLSRNYFVSSFIILLILASFGTTISLVTNDRVVIARELFQPTRVHVHECEIITVLITAMLTDVSITIALLWQLNRSWTWSQRTRGLIARISSQAIKTGVVPCIFALITLISYIVYKNQNIANCFAYLLGRVYTSTMLFSLIYRDKLRPGGKWVPRIATTPLPRTESEPTSPMTFARPQSLSGFPAVPVLARDKGSDRDSTSRLQQELPFTQPQSMFLQDTNSDLTSFDPHTLDVWNEPSTSHNPDRASSLSLAELGACEL